MDRSIIDFGSDPTRSRIPISNINNSLLKFLLPKGKHFYLNVSPDVVVARKGELSLQKAESLKIAYLKVCSETGVIQLDGNNSYDEVFRQLLTHISEVYLHRIRNLEHSK